MSRTEVIDWNAPPAERHYVRRAYGPPQPWPKDRPATWAPVALHATRYAADSAIKPPSVVVTIPRGQWMPVRALGAEPEKKPLTERQEKVRNTGVDILQKAAENPVLTGIALLIGGAALITALRTIGKLTGG